MYDVKDALDRRYVPGRISRAVLHDEVSSMKRERNAKRETEPCDPPSPTPLSSARVCVVDLLVGCICVCLLVRPYCWLHCCTTALACALFESCCPSPNFARVSANMGPRPTAEDGTEGTPVTFTIEIQATLKRSMPVPRLNLGSVTGSTEMPPENVGEEGSDVAPVPPPIYQAPVFRYTFLDGSTNETPLVPTTDDPVDGWSEVELELSSEPAKEEPATEEDDNAEDGASAIGDNDQPPQAPPPPPPKRWKYTQEITVATGVTEEFARSIHQDPTVVCVLGNLLSQIPPAADAPEDQLPAEDQNFVEFLPLDTSVFLDGDQSVSLTLSAEDFTLPNPPEGLLYWSFKISTPKPLLTKDQRVAYNPLVIHTKKVRCLPGIYLESNNPTMLENMKPTRFSLLERYCSPIFATFKFPPTPIGGFQRIVRTCSFPQVNVPPTVLATESEGQSTARSDATSKSFKRKNARLYIDESRRDANFNHKTVFLASFMDKNELIAQLNNSDMQFELHDRDIMLTEAQMTQRREKWEAALKATKATEEDEVDDSPASTDDVYSIGKRAWQDVLEQGAVSREINTYGMASCRLYGLLSSSKSISRGFRRASGRTAEDPLCLDFKIIEGIRPQKRSTSMSADEEQLSWDFSETDRLVRYCGAYLLTDTEVIVDASIARSPEDVTETLENTLKVVEGTEAELDTYEGDSELVKDGGNAFDPLTETGERSIFANTSVHATDVSLGVGARKERLFERAIYCIGYDDNEMLHAIQDLMKKVNSAALPGTALRAHQLTPEQTAAAEAGELDIICGFQVIDSDFRIIVLEGLGTGGIAMLHREVRRTRKNGPMSRVLGDPTVRFLKREYTPFQVDLKRIKLRDRLPEICETPDIYNRAKVPLKCFEALHRLFRLRNANRLRHVAESDLFPRVDQLLVLESKYGEAISLEDMDGDRATHAVIDFDDDDYVATDDEEEAKEPEQEKDVVELKATKTRMHSDKRKADTDCWNDAFEQFLLEQAKIVYPNRPKIQAEMARRVKMETLNSRKLRQESEKLVLPPEVKGEIYIYSGQKLQFTEFQKEQMRKRLSKVKDATFTYSQEFQSMTMCLVNEDDIEKDAQLASLAKFTTPGGFVYPAPKDPAEYSKHPKQVSKQRQEELREPHIENSSTGAPPGRSFQLKVGQKDFDTVPVIKSKPFGGYNADGTKANDVDFYQSVFMGGDGVEEEMMEAVKLARQQWKDAVMVDNIHFNTHYGEKGTKPSQLGKLDDILDGGKANKLGLKVVHNAKLPSGKRIPFQAPPATIMALDEFEDPKDFTAGMRPNDPEHFYGTTATGEKVGFITAIHQDANKPFRQKYLHRRKVTQLDPAEKTGPKFFGGEHQAGTEQHPTVERTNAMSRTGPPGFKTAFSEDRKDGPKYVPPKLPKL